MEYSERKISQCILTLTILTGKNSVLVLILILVLVLIRCKNESWLAASDLFYMFTHQLSSMHSITHIKGTDV